MRRPRHRCRLLAGCLHEARRHPGHGLELVDHDHAAFDHREPRHQFEQQHVAGLDQRQREPEFLGQHQFHGRLRHGFDEQLRHAEFERVHRHEQQFFEHDAFVEHVEQHHDDALTP
jgi:hypothetical protein